MANSVKIRIEGVQAEEVITEIETAIDKLNDCINAIHTGELDEMQVQFLKSFNAFKKSSDSFISFFIGSKLSVFSSLCSSALVFSG